MASVANRSRSFDAGTAVICLTQLQQTLWQLGVPILDSGAVARHKKRAKLSMLLSAIQWQLLGMTASVGFECLGRDWHRAGLVGVAALVLAGLFTWLVSISDLQWVSIDYASYENLHSVPTHVSAVANALACSGVAGSRIRVEYLKDDPILFVEENGELATIRRYNLVIW